MRTVPLTEELFLSILTLGFICMYAAFQSIAGVGLLLFGTPTLVLVGYSFTETLAILVPTSLLVSLLQIKGDARVTWEQVIRVTAQGVRTLTNTGERQRNVTKWGNIWGNILASRDQVAEYNRSKCNETD